MQSVINDGPVKVFDLGLLKDAQGEVVIVRQPERRAPSTDAEQMFAADEHGWRGDNCSMIGHCTQVDSSGRISRDLQLSVMLVDERQRASDHSHGGVRV